MTAMMSKRAPRAMTIQSHISESSLPPSEGDGTGLGLGLGSGPGVGVGSGPGVGVGSGSTQPPTQASYTVEGAKTLLPMPNCWFSISKTPTNDLKKTSPNQK